MIKPTSTNVNCVLLNVLLWILFVICVSWSSLLYWLVCSLRTCYRLTSWLSCVWCFLVFFIHFSMWFPGSCVVLGSIEFWSFVFFLILLLVFSIIAEWKKWMFYLFCWILYVPVKSYGPVGTVSSPSNTFFLGQLDLAVNQYFVHILSLVTDNNPSWIAVNQYFVHILSLVTDNNPSWISGMMRMAVEMISWSHNFAENMEPGRDRTCDSWICRHTRYRLRYAAGWRNESKSLSRKGFVLWRCEVR